MPPQLVAMVAHSLAIVITDELSGQRCSVGSKLEVCMEMGKTGIPWDSHGNESKISHGMGMGIKTWELEKRRTTLSPATVNSLLFLHSNME